MEHEACQLDIVQGEMNLFGFVAWRIWHDRNSLVQDKVASNSQVSYSATFHRYNEYAGVTMSQGRGVKEKQKATEASFEWVFEVE